MIRVMYIDFQKLGIHYDGGDFSLYVKKIQDIVNVRLLSLKYIPVRGISMTQLQGELSSLNLLYEPGRRMACSARDPSPHPIFLIHSLENIDNVEGYVNDVITALEESNRYVNYVKVINGGQMDPYFTIMHTPILERRYP